MSDSILELRSIHMRRNDKQILNGVDFHIRSGEHWALLGANGSGKTSLLKIVTGYEWPTRGTVTVLGQTFGECNLPELRKHIGWVSTAIEQQFYPSDTAIDTVLSGLDATIGLYRAYSDDERARAQKMLMSLGAGALMEQPFGRLSQGEQQRVLIARALICQPSLLVLDEACAGLDPAARVEFLDDLARFTRDPGAPACIVVTHHVEEIGPWITHALVLKGGNILATGKVEQVLTSNTLSAAFGRTCTLRGDRAGGYRLDL